MMIEGTAVNLFNAKTGHFDGMGNKWKFSRLPEKGELILLESRDDESELVCEVLFVIHIPEGLGDCDAEVYAAPCSLDDAIKKAKTDARASASP